MSDPVTVLAGGAIVSGGLGIYNTLNRPGAPDLPPAPQPMNNYTYDDLGNVTSSTVYDPTKNAYVTKSNPEPDKPKDIGAAPDKNDRKYLSSDSDGNQTFNQQAYNKDLSDYGKATDKYKSDMADYNTTYAKWKKGADERQAAHDKLVAENKQRGEIRSQYLTNLSQTPEDRIKAYDEYANAYSDAMHKNVDREFNKTVRSTDEKMNATGMMGSRAYVDTQNELNKDKQTMDTDIADKAVMAKNTLGQVDKNFWLQGVNALDNKIDPNVMLEMQRGQNSMNSAVQGTAATMAEYGANTNNIMNKWAIENQRNANDTQNLLGTATGLAYLYGYNKGGGSSSLAPVTGSYRGPNNWNMGTYAMNAPGGG